MAYFASFYDMYNDISLQSLSDLDFDLTGSLKVKCDGAVRATFVISYWCLVVTHGLIRLIYGI